VTKDGYFPAKASLLADAAREWAVHVELEPRKAVEEQIKVYATRNDVRIQDSPLHVEVLQREEVEEKMLMTPGDIVMMLNEMGGMRVQTTSPSLGAASVRVQGMRGRYTSFLSDGLPLFGQQGAALGLLQISPMDLGQVEVIKGNASALYGSAAMAGVVNLISRRPPPDPVLGVSYQPFDSRSHGCFDVPGIAAVLAFERGAIPRMRPHLGIADHSRRRRNCRRTWRSPRPAN
jgi:iron complex outermembrane receptor protein